MKIDYFIAALIGFFVGIFAIPAFLNIGYRSPVLLLALPWIGSAAIIVGVWLGNAIGKKIPLLIQLARFAAVGFLNTAIDFGTLNLASFLTGVTSGIKVGGINLPGVSIALVNAYFWNKLWVFGAEESQGQKSKGVLADVPKFIIVSGTAILLNTGIVVFATTYATPLFGAEGSLWLNIAKVMATAVSMVWTFLGYKFIVFKKKNAVSAQPPIAPL